MEIRIHLVSSLLVHLKNGLPYVLLLFLFLLFIFIVVVFFLDKK